MAWGFVVNRVIIILEHTWQLLFCNKAITSPCMWERSSGHGLWFIGKTPFLWSLTCAFPPTRRKLNEAFTLPIYFWVFCSVLSLSLSSMLELQPKETFFIWKTNKDPIKSEIILKNNLPIPTVLSTPLSQREVTGFPKWQPCRSYGMDLHSSACSPVIYSLLTGGLVDFNSISGWCSSPLVPSSFDLSPWLSALLLLWFSFTVISDLYAGSANLLFQIKIRCMLCYPLLTL